MTRTLADSQELFIAISDSYSFPGMHCVTSKEGVGADGEFGINKSTNTSSALCFFPVLPLLDKTTSIMSSTHGSKVLEYRHHIMWS